MKKTKLDISKERDKFIKDYAKKKGWNPNELSPSQLVEIISSLEHQTLR
jgi:hypothetical protein